MKIRLSNKFYKREALDEAAEAFKEVCSCRIISEDFDLELLPKIEGDDSRLRDEFCNFVLGITKDKMLF
jgi:hypothetical protein